MYSTGIQEKSIHIPTVLASTPEIGLGDIVTTAEIGMGDIVTTAEVGMVDMPIGLNLRVQTTSLKLTL